MNHVFGSFADMSQARAAVDSLVAAGFAARTITVLLPDNRASREFARMMGTKVPPGTQFGPKADRPLEGSLGILDPAAGPQAGALDDALNGMGVPLDWPHGVPEGKLLVSVETPDTDAASAVFVNAGALNVGTPAGAAPAH